MLLHATPRYTICITLCSPAIAKAEATTLITLHRNYNSTKLQLQLTLHPAAVGEVTTATIASVPATKDTTPTTLESISGFPLSSVIHNNRALLYVSYSETSATAWCGTGIAIAHGLLENSQ